MVTTLFLHHMALSAGDVIVAGYTYSSDFPAVAGTHDETHNGRRVRRQARRQSRKPARLDVPGGLAFRRRDRRRLGPLGNVYVTGYTYSDDFPVTPGVFDATHNGSADAFVGWVDLNPAAVIPED